MRLGLTAALAAVALFALTGCSQPNATPESTTQQAVPTVAATTAFPAPVATPTSQPIPRRRSTPPPRPYPKPRSHRRPRPLLCLPLRPSLCLRQHSRLQLLPFPCLPRHPCPPPHPFTSGFQPSFPRLLLRGYLWKQAQDPRQPNPAALLSPRYFHSPSRRLNLIPGVMPSSPYKDSTRGKG